MTTSKVKIIKIYCLISTAIILGCIFAILHFKNELVRQNEFASKYEKEKKYYELRSDLMDIELILRKKSLGLNLNIDYSKIKNIISSRSLVPLDIIIVASPEYFAYSNKMLFTEYQKKYSRNIGIIVSSPDLTFVTQLTKDIVSVIPVYIDYELQYSNHLELAENEAVVLVETTKGKIIYSYVVEEGNPLKDVEQREIIMNILDNKK